MQTEQELKSYQVEITVSAWVNIKASSQAEARALASLTGDHMRHTLRDVSSMVGLADVGEVLQVDPFDQADAPWIERTGDNAKAINFTPDDKRRYGCQLTKPS